MYLPVFLCLYESFWKGFEYDQRRLTLPVSNVCFLERRTRQLRLKLTINSPFVLETWDVTSRPIYEAPDKQPFDISNVNRLWSDSNLFQNDS